MRESLRKSTTLDGRLLCKGVPLSRSCRARARPNALNPMCLCVCVCVCSQTADKCAESAGTQQRGAGRRRVRVRRCEGPQQKPCSVCLLEHRAQHKSRVWVDSVEGQAWQDSQEFSANIHAPTLEGGCTSKSTVPTTCVRTQPAQCHALRHLATHLHALTDRAGSNEADRPFCVLSSPSLSQHQPLLVRSCRQAAMPGRPPFPFSFFRGPELQSSPDDEI